MTEELYTIINKEIDNINKTVTGEKIDLVDLSSGESIKKLTTILRRYKTLSEKKEGAK
jgi:hypothetical protein